MVAYTAKAASNLTSFLPPLAPATVSVPSACTAACLTFPCFTVFLPADTEDILQALPDLSRLNLNGCISLSRVDLPDCNKLTWLDCSGCASLHHITLASPLLSGLRAVACQRLVVSHQPLLRAGSIHFDCMDVRKCILALHAISLASLVLSSLRGCCLSATYGESSGFSSRWKHSIVKRNGKHTVLGVLYREA